MDRDPQTDYEFQLWTQANQLTGIVTSLLDALKTSFGLLLVAKPVLPEDSRLDCTLENFKRIITAGERAAKGFGIDLSEEVYSFSRELEEKVKQHTAELEKRTRQLVEAEKLCALGEMANMIAHELRNSLMVIGGFAKRLYENSKNASLNKEHLKIIVDEVKILEDKVSRISKTREMESSN